MLKTKIDEIFYKWEEERCGVVYADTATTIWTLSWRGGFLYIFL